LSREERSQGIVLRRWPVTESSLVVTWFTREHGKVKTLAKGARRAKGPFQGKLDLFYEGELVWLRSRRTDLHLLHDCFLIEPHLGLRQSVPQLTAASYVCELMEAVEGAEDANPAVYELLAEVLGRCAERVDAVMLIWFELQLLRLSGWERRWEDATATSKVLRALGKTTGDGASRVRLSAEQVAAGREVLWQIWDEELGRPVRSRKSLA
jgi:DNA repair protein RecO (recombination protein O)